jgi:DNA-binding response OmpR family regulator
MWKGKPVQLTVTEFLLVKTLAIRPGLVKNRDQLIDAPMARTSTWMTAPSTAT